MSLLSQIYPIHTEYLVLFFWVLISQIGLPISAIPFLIAAGALVAIGKTSFVVSLAIILLASLPADSLWYELGRRRGSTVLESICKLSFANDTCARRTEMTFQRYGVAALVISKFLPGIHFAASPLSGAFGLSRGKFQVFNVLGTLIWGFALLSIGFAAGGPISEYTQMIFRHSGLLTVATLIALALGISLWRWRSRRNFARRLLAEMISPDRLWSEISSGKQISIIDVRHRLDVLAVPVVIPGALRIPLEDLKRLDSGLMTEGTIVVYCTCPNQASSIMAAQEFAKAGYKNARVLDGGLRAWQKRGYPVQPFLFNYSRQDELKRVWSF